MIGLGLGLWHAAIRRPPKPIEGEEATSTGDTIATSDGNIIEVRS